MARKLQAQNLTRYSTARETHQHRENAQHKKKGNLNSESCLSGHWLQPDDSQLLSRPTGQSLQTLTTTACFPVEEASCTKQKPHSH